MILLRTEGRPAASHTAARALLQKPDGAEKVWPGAEGLKEGKDDDRRDRPSLKDHLWSV